MLRRFWPDFRKTTADGGNNRLCYAISTMTGWRLDMEDTHTIELELEEGDVTNAFFAVFDGHNGALTAEHARDNLHKRLTADPAYVDGDYPTALKNAFLRLDAAWQELDSGRTTWETACYGPVGGCTAITCLISHDEKLFVANAGDSRCVLSIKGDAEPLSTDHKPNNPKEMIRIRAAGGYVTNNRVDGSLGLSRALGDFEFKTNEDLPPERQKVTCDPEVTHHQITEEDEFLILACDGIWDCLSSQQVVDAVRLLVSQDKTLAVVCEEICDHCMAPDLRGGGGTDNMTIMIVALLHGRTVEEWYNWITERTNNQYGCATPVELPSLYHPVRLEAFCRARDEREARQWKRTVKCRIWVQLAASGNEALTDPNADAHGEENYNVNEYADALLLAIEHQGDDVERGEWDESSVSLSVQVQYAYAERQHDFATMSAQGWPEQDAYVAISDSLTQDASDFASVDDSTAPPAAMMVSDGA